MDLQKDKCNIDNEEKASNSSIKCHDSPIVVDNDSMELQPDKSNIDNEEKLVMF